MNRRKLLLLGITLFFLALLASSSRSTASVPQAPGDRIPDWEAAGPGGNGYALFGFAVKSAGDVNGDGYDDVNADGEADVVVGSPMYERSYGYYGLPELPPTPTPTATATRTATSTPTATATRTATPTPTALDGVDLLYFLAESGEGQILLKWETASELNNAGFFVMRSLDIAGPYLRISGFIPSQGDGITGAYYEYPDHDVVAGTWYYYILEMVNIGGASVFTEPVSVLYGGSTITRNPTLPSSPTTTPTATSTVTPTQTQQPNIRIYIPAVFNH